METTPLTAGGYLHSATPFGAELYDGFAHMVGHDAGLAATVHRARLLTRVSAPVLLQGETGVGKEVFARAIHNSGPHPQAPFVALNCGGLPRELLASELFGYVDGAFTGARRSGMVGKLEAAHGGTLFLDELAEMPLDLQPYLLRVLEGGEFYPVGSTKPRKAKFRLIAACNRDLRAEAVADRFRMDLFFRVSVTALEIPALRDRLVDLPALVRHFAREAAERHELTAKQFDPAVLRAFERYSWPGNIRELRNVVESMVLMTESELVDLSVLPAILVAPPLYGLSPAAAPSEPSDMEPLRGLPRLEREAIGDALRAYGGNLTRVARELQIARSTLYLKLKKYELEPVLNELRFGSRQAVCRFSSSEQPQP